MTLADKIRNFGNQALSVISGDYTAQPPSHTGMAPPAYTTSPGQPIVNHHSMAHAAAHSAGAAAHAAQPMAPPLASAHDTLPNYPTATPASPSNNLNYYTTDKVATDNYWSATKYQNEAQDRPGLFTSLTGEDVVAAELEHNNMQPFFGSNVTQSVPDMAVESRLDNMVGAGSQHIEKRGSAPLFAPAPNHGVPYGMQCHTDFLQCRQVPSTRIANAKPFEEERVAPGLGLGSQSNEGLGGYNAGVLARESWLPKTVDELRAPNKPKVSYEAQMLGGSMGTAGERGDIGVFGQKGPDRTMTLGDGLVPAAGSTWAEAAMARGEYADPHSDRGQSTELSQGPAGSNVPSNDRRDAIPNPVHRVGAHDMKGRVSGPAAMNGAPGTVKHYSDEALPTARGSSLGESFYGAASTLAREVIMPVLGTFKLLNKEIASSKPTPYIAPAGPEGTYKRYLDKARPTLKETTLVGEVGPAAGTALGWGVAANYGAPRKADPNTPQIVGAMGPSGMVSQEAERNAYVPSHRADMQVAYTPNGNIAIPSGDQGETRLRNTPQVKDYSGGAASVIPSSANMAQVGALTATRQTHTDPSGNFASYSEILGQLDSNPYIPGQV
jgi:hypothetical protein